jgi:transposase
MPAPYSLDLRNRVIAAVESGLYKTEICQLYQISRKTLYSWLERYQKQGNLEPITGFQKGHSHLIKDLEAFRCYVDDHPDQTQEEMAAAFQVSRATIGRALKKIGYSRKKRVLFMKSETKKKGKPIKIK